MVDCGVKGPLFYNNVPTSTALFNVRYKLEGTQYRPVVEEGERSSMALNATTASLKGTLSVNVLVESQPLHLLYL